MKINILGEAQGSPSGAGGSFLCMYCPDYYSYMPGTPSELAGAGAVMYRINTSKNAI